MRATTLLRLLSRLHPQHTVVEAFEFAADHKTLVLDVKPTTRVPVCGVCEKRDGSAVPCDVITKPCG